MHYQRRFEKIDHRRPNVRNNGIWASRIDFGDSVFGRVSDGRHGRSIPERWTGLKSQASREDV